MRIKRNELLLFATPLLAIAIALLLGGLNRYIIQQEEKAQLQPSFDQNGALMITRQRQPDGSIKEFDRSNRLLNIRPANTIKRRGLLQFRYLFYVVAAAVTLSLLCLLIVSISTLLHRSQNQA